MNPFSWLFGPEPKQEPITDEDIRTSILLGTGFTLGGPGMRPNLHDALSYLLREIEAIKEKK